MPRNFVDKSFWNAALGVNNTNVTLPGEINSMFQNLGLPCPPQYGSQDDLGKRAVFAEKDMVPQASSQFLLGTGAALFGGMYQLVFVDSGATAANVGAGKAAFILDTATGGAAGSGALVYAVTDESHAVALPHMCGVFLNSVTPGNFGWIQVHGKCPVQYRAVVTAATAGGAIQLAGLGTGVFDVPAAGNLTFILYGQILGNAISTPANAALGTCLMRNVQGRY